MSPIGKPRLAAAVVVLAAFTGFFFSAASASPAQQGKADKPSLQARSAAADAFVPRAMGRSGRADAAAVKKRPIWPWLVAGTVFLGAAAYFLFLKPDKSGSSGPDLVIKRDVAVQSTPSGAAVFLDGQPTGLSTNCVLKSVTAASHTIRLEKDGYRDYEASFNVSTDPRMPTVLDVSLDRAAISVAAPRAGIIQETGQVLPIQWSVDYQALAGANPEIRALGLTNVRLELWKGGAKTADIAASTPNDGAYDWDVPASQPTGEGYSVRVVCPTEAAIYGESAPFTIAIRITRVYDGNTPPSNGFDYTCSFDAPIDVPDEGRIIAFGYRMRCYNETGVDITLVAPDGTQLARPSYDYRDFVPTSAFDGHWMRGTWRLEVRDLVRSIHRDDITWWDGWKIEITYLDWNR